MRGVVFTGNSTLDLVHFDDPVPGPADVVLEIKASGLCGSDLKLYRPAKEAAFKALGLIDSGEPIIAGHEPCGGRWCTWRMEVEMAPAPNCYAVAR